MKSYSKDFNEQLANELLEFPTNSATEEVIKDYVELRDRIRACRQASGS